MKYEFPFTKREVLREKPITDELGFGRYIADYMSQAIYTVGTGWHSLGVVPYGPIPITPAASVLHYGQEMFEGTKAFRRNDGSVWLFRPDMNMKRARATCERVAMPDIPDELFLNAMVEGLKANMDWMPEGPGTALYLRPVMFASEEVIGVRAANEYMFFVVYCPVGSYYGNGQLVPSKIYVEDTFSRAAPGGTGFTKTSGNYAAAMRSEMNAIERGYNQVLWTDAATHTLAEEIGTSNAFFVIDGTVITAPLGGTILPGITRDSCLTLLRDWGVPVEERNLPVQEIWEAYQAGTLEEIFSTGTAAIVSPIGILDWDEKHMVIHNNECGPIARRLYDTLDQIRLGTLPDTHGWMYRVK